MKTLLFKVKHYLTEENRFGHRVWAELPSNILTTAQYLNDNGMDPDVRDDAVYEDQLFENYDVVAIWASLADGLYEALDYLRVAKQKGCTTILVLFDDWSGMQREIIMDYDFVDFGIRRWDIETTLKNLIISLSTKELSEIKGNGLVFRSNDEVIDGGEAIYYPHDLHHLTSSRKWIEALSPSNYKRFAVRAGSGCPFKCTFCHISRRANRFRKIDDLLDELSILPSQQEAVKVLSADMLQDWEWVTKFCEGIIDRGIKIHWETDTRLNWLTDMSQLKMLRKSGCIELAIGVESYHPTILKGVKKGYSQSQIDEGLKNLVKAGIKPALNMMIGHPEESNETLSETEKFLDKLSPSEVQVCGVQYLRPLPGTKINTELLNNGLLEKQLDYKDFYKSRDEPVVATKYLDKEQIVAWHDRLVNAYYS